MEPRSKQLSLAYGGILAELVVVLAVALAACGGPGGGAAGATTAGRAEAGNWGFERGDLTGWRTSSRGSGAWHAYADGATPPDPGDTDRQFPFKVPEPPEGSFAAVTDMSAPGTRILYREVRLRGRSRLRFTLFYENHAGELSSPASLDSDRCEPNQQLRIDLVDPAAPVDSVAAKHVLATIFRTAPGDPGRIDPREVTFDLSRWAGRRVRIRFAQVDNRGPLRAGVDDVRLEAVAA